MYTTTSAAPFDFYGMTMLRYIHSETFRKILSEPAMHLSMPRKSNINWISFASDETRHHAHYVDVTKPETTLRSQSARPRSHTTLLDKNMLSYYSNERIADALGTGINKNINFGSWTIIIVYAVESIAKSQHNANTCKCIISLINLRLCGWTEIVVAVNVFHRASRYSSSSVVSSAIIYRRRGSSCYTISVHSCSKRWGSVNSRLTISKRFRWIFCVDGWMRRESYLTKNCFLGTKFRIFSSQRIQWSLLTLMPNECAIRNACPFISPNSIKIVWFYSKKKCRNYDAIEATHNHIEFIVVPFVYAF